MYMLCKVIISINAIVFHFLFPSQLSVNQGRVCTYMSRDFHTRKQS